MAIAMALRQGLAWRVGEEARDPVWLKHTKLEK